MYKAIIVEDEMFVRMGIRMSVEWEKLGVEIAGDAENGQAAWELPAGKIQTVRLFA
mgnify:CR=1 FL=1